MLPGQTFEGSFAEDMTFYKSLCAATLGLTLLPSAGMAEIMGLTCTFTRVCNNFQACEDISYDLAIGQTQDGWVFNDSDGERPAVKLPPSNDGKGIPAFASDASYDSTMLLTLYSGGPAMLVEHFEEPGFWSYNGSCDLMQ